MILFSKGPKSRF